MADENKERLPELREVEIADIIPEDWLDRQVWISCYRAYCIPQQLLLDTGPFNLLGVQGQLFWGGAPYWQSTLVIEPLVDGEVLTHLNVEGIQHADDGPYLMLITPTDWGATPEAEEETRSRIRSVLALLRLALGKNVAVEPLGDLIFIAATKQVNAMERGFRPPQFDGRPDLSAGGSELVSYLHDAIERLDDPRRNRVELSLQWFLRAEQTPAVSGFLMYWFTLEALAMPGSTSLVVLERQLAAVYGLSLEDSRQRFRMGRLYGLRGDIVHQGVHPAIHVRVLDFMAAVYWDLLLHALGLSPMYRAGSILDAENPGEWFPG